MLALEFFYRRKNGGEISLILKAELRLSCLFIDNVFGQDSFLLGTPGVLTIYTNHPVGNFMRKHFLTELGFTQAAQAQDVNKLFNSDTVTQRTIYRDCMGNLPLCLLCLSKATNVQIKATYFKV